MSVLENTKAKNSKTYQIICESYQKKKKYPGQIKRNIEINNRLDT